MPPRRSLRLIQAVSAKSVRSALSTLPLELHHNICSHLPQNDLLSLLKTDRSIYEATLPILYKNGTLKIKPKRHRERMRDGRPYHPPFLPSWSQIRKINIFINVTAFSAGLQGSKDLSLVRQIGRSLRSWPGKCKVTLRVPPLCGVPQANCETMRALRNLDGFRKIVVRLTYRRGPPYTIGREYLEDYLEDYLEVEEGVRVFLGPGRFCDKKTIKTGMALRYGKEDGLWRRGSWSLDDDTASKKINPNRNSLKKDNASGQLSEPSYVEFYPLDYKEKKKALRQTKTEER